MQKDKVDPNAKTERHFGTVFRVIVCQVAAVCLPVSLVEAALIGLVLKFQITPTPTLFPNTGNSTYGLDNGYILVRFSATRLVFLASWLSTMAPMLACFVMALWSLQVARAIKTASNNASFRYLPTPYQMSLIAGLTFPSIGRLRMYYQYLLTKSRPSIPPVLHGAAAIFSLCCFLATGVVIADTALHYFTSTIGFVDIVYNNESMSLFSRGLSDRCLNWKRSPDFLCFPCSAAIWTDEAQEMAVIAARNELYFLQHNTSTISQIRLIEYAGIPETDLALLLPQTENLDPNIDYRGSSVAVSTQCSPVIQNCSPKHTGVDAFNTQFNCSSGFYGVIGLPPVVSDSGSNINQPVDSNVPPLNWKPFLNLQYGYYADPSLQDPYDTGTYNITNGAVRKKPRCLNDDSLLNPVWLGVVGRFSSSSQLNTNNLSLESDPNMLVGNGTYIDFALNCSYTTYDANYSWVNGMIQDLIVSQSPNGTLAEMYHGDLYYVSYDGGAHDMVDAVLQAAQENTAQKFARKWAGQHSIRVLSHIGSFTSPQVNLEEQMRNIIQVTKVPLVALGVLLGISFCYVVLAIVAGVIAYLAFSADVQDLSARMTLVNLSVQAFEGGGTGHHDCLIKDPDETLSKMEDGTRRVGPPRDGLHLRLYRLSSNDAAGG
jgi:hypothetical protein